MQIRILTSKDATCERVPLKGELSKYIISLELQDQVKVTDEKTGSYVLVPTVVETSRVDADEYIQSFKDDVGIENIMKKFALTGDLNVFNQRTRPSIPVGDDGKEAIQDYSILPDNEEQALKYAENARAVFKQLPPELVKNRSFMEFAENCTDAEILAYIEAYNKAHSGGNNNE